MAAKVHKAKSHSDYSSDFPVWVRVFERNRSKVDSYCGQLVVEDHSGRSFGNGYKYRSELGQNIFSLRPHTFNTFHCDENRQRKY